MKTLVTKFKLAILLAVLAVVFFGISTNRAVASGTEEPPASEDSESAGDDEADNHGDSGSTTEKPAPSGSGTEKQGKKDNSQDGSSHAGSTTEHK